jgi:hypothetical protein
VVRQAVENAARLAIDGFEARPIVVETLEGLCRSFRSALRSFFRSALKEVGKDEARSTQTAPDIVDASGAEDKDIDSCIQEVSMLLPDAKAMMATPDDEEEFWTTIDPLATYDAEVLEDAISQLRFDGPQVDRLKKTILKYRNAVSFLQKEKRLEGIRAPVNKKSKTWKELVKKIAEAKVRFPVIREELRELFSTHEIRAISR